MIGIDQTSGGIGEDAREGKKKTPALGGEDGERRIATEKRVENIFHSWEECGDAKTEEEPGIEEADVEKNRVWGSGGGVCEDFE